ncbi:MAG TPA: phosphomannose isomerase type II C-terminal cupin domain [Azospirillaceae bacterium]|nr:phosphomannose isomerase type II C-terminal cupin domain [Azospirillaceae bacterium]
MTAIQAQALDATTARYVRAASDVRPWGSWEVIDVGDRFCAKRITVKPGCRLSLQYHHHRHEHWIVVSGTALVTVGPQTFSLQENDSVRIPVGVTHRLENVGPEELVLIEVQYGERLEESDIVRLEDSYGRV